LNDVPGGEQAGGGGEAEPSEEELRARLEEELKRITVRDVLVQTAVTLVNLGGQRLGLTEQSRDARDLAQSRTAIDAVRALMPLLERDDPDVVRPLRDALAQLQMAYAQEVGAEGTPADAEPDATGPAPGGQQAPGESGRTSARRGSHGGLWVPPGSE
jgi:hypothetical protein